MQPHIIHVNLAKGFRGGERQTALLIEALADSKLQQTLVCRADSPLRQHLAQVPQLRFIAARHMLAGHWQSRDGLLVHAHEAKAAHWAFIHNRLCNAPYIITRRVPNPLKNKVFTKSVYRNSQCCVALSRAIESIIQRYDPRLKTRLIPSALAHLSHDQQQVDQLHQEFQGRFVIGHIGALVDKHKGQSILIEAARLLQQRYPDLLFIFLGQGEDEARFKALSQDLPNVRWLGFQRNVGDYLSIMDLFAFPSLNEGLGSVLLDVMDFEVPIVASAVGGIPDIIQHEHTGLLVPPRDAQALAQAIERLYLDASLRRQLTQRAKAQLARYTPAAMAASYLQLYREILGERLQD